MNRIDRLHAIVVHLQSKKRVTAQEIADRFGLSLRTVYRDVKALDEAGVPVIGEAGSGYSIMQGYRLPPLMFTREEASALLLGTKFAVTWSDEKGHRFFESALFKIKAVLRDTDKDYVEGLAESIAVAPPRLPIEEAGGQFLFGLQQAIAQKKVISMTYHAVYEDKITERQVEPVGVCHYGTCWHLIGWCRMRKGYRDFRISRIQQLQVTDEIFTTTHPTLKKYLEDVVKNARLEEVVVDFDKSIVKYLREVKYFNGFVSEEERGDVVRMKFLTAYPESFGRWLLMYTNAVKIVSPASFNKVMKQLAHELKGHY